MNTINLVQYYKRTARKLNEEAKQYLNSGENNNLLLCCLKLRMCLECLSYEKVVPFEEKLNLTELKKWQPRQLIKFLTQDIEPHTNLNSTIEIFNIGEDGKPEGDPLLTGSERVLSMKEISRFYDKLGSYLHSPTMAQVTSDNTNNFPKLQLTCNELITIIDEVLSSTIYSSPMMETRIINCHSCKEQVICYVPLWPLPKTLEVTCGNCQLEIEVQIDESGNSHL